MTPIIAGVVMAFVIAYVTFVPVIILQYRRHGDVSKIKNLVGYSVILYMLCAYFLVILPLPTRAEVAQLTTPYYNLVPFKFLEDIQQHSGLSLSNPRTYIGALKSPSVFTVLFNILLTLPLGVYGKKYFRLSFWKTMLLGFSISLFFELTQLSGLYGIYPRPYRLFDVDDLLMNTLGAVVGYGVGKVMNPLLPEERLSIPDQRVTILRRFLAYYIDTLVIGLIVAVISGGLQLIGRPISNDGISLVVWFSYFVFLPLIFYQTIGQGVLKIELRATTGHFSLTKLLKRAIIIGIVLKLNPLLIEKDFSFGQEINVMALMSQLIFMIILLSQIVRKKEQLFYDRWSNLVLVPLKK